MAIKGAIWDLDGTKYAFPPGFYDACDWAVVRTAQELLPQVMDPAAIPDPDTLFKIAKDNYAQHGLSFAFLILAHGLPKKDVHGLYHQYAPIDMVSPLPDLRGAFADISHLEHMIYTHASHDWARRVLAVAGLSDAYPDHRIAALDTLNFAFKHADEHGWRHCMETMGLTGPELAMIDDTPSCLRIPKRLGMTTIQIAPQGTAQADHVDHVVEDGAAACRLLRTLSL